LIASCAYDASMFVNLCNHRLPPYCQVPFFDRFPCDHNGALDKKRVIVKLPELAAHVIDYPVVAKTISLFQKQKILFFAKQKNPADSP